VILPKKIKCGGHIYRVLFPYQFKERSDLCGQADHDVAQIRIRNSDPCGNTVVDSRVFEVFVHELLHVVDFVYNGNELDEEMNERLGQGVAQVLLDNFDLYLKNGQKIIVKR